MATSHPERQDWGTCITPGCNRFVAVRKHELCNKHYAKHLRGEGTNERNYLIDPKAAERFWSLVDMRDKHECWPWKLAPHVQGNGTFWDKNVSYHAHIVSFELTNGRVPEGLLVDHKCRNRICVNPGHLHAVTHKENTENVTTYRNSPFGVRGVTQRSTGKFRARVGHNGTVLHVGDFDTLEEASAAVLSARLRLHTNNLEDRGERYG